VKIGDDLKISGAVSMDDAGNLVGAGNMDQQMKNCYSDLEKILKHYGYTFDDVVAENVYTTNMAEFIKYSTYRNTIYKKQFPTGTWLEVKGLALPDAEFDYIFSHFTTKKFKKHQCVNVIAFIAVIIILLCDSTTLSEFKLFSKRLKN
jgi:enamine deaminase RidA (YjgF/YER057c/UK114 family)